MSTARSAGAARRPAHLTARLRLTTTYAVFTVAAGALALAVIYVVVRKFPSYPLTSAQAPGLSGPNRGQILDSLIALSGVALAVMALAGLVGGWIVAGRVLRPLQALNAAVRRAAAGELDHRVGATGSRDEFQDLAATFDDMLARLERAFAAQQRFAANASHELRTPLATMQTLIEVAQANPGGRDVDRTLVRLHETNQRGIAIVQALLQLSSLERKALVPRVVDLAEVARDAVTLVAPEASGAGLRLTATTESAPTIGDPVLLGQLATNLVQNAVRHNVPGGWLTISTGRRPNGDAVLDVRNSGEELDPQSLLAFVEPFGRRDARLARRGGAARGNGLGLTLSNRIAELHGGRLELSPSAGGGLAVVLVLGAHGRSRERSGVSPG